MQSVSNELSLLLRKVYSRTSGAVRPGLDTVRALLECLDNPQDRIGVIHVAGTNGKGSVCAMLEGILGKAGFRTGMYTSPHLIRVNERFRLNGKDVSDALLYEYLKHVVERDEERCAESDTRPATFFELMTALGFSLFCDQAVDIALVETGMGGRWDATNVTIPLLSVITNIEHDHMNFLGDDISKIAGEKAGIIKKGRPVVLGEIREDARAVILQQVAELGAEIIQADRSVSVHGCVVKGDAQTFVMESADQGYGRITLPLPGGHQMRNCAVAVAAYETLAKVVQLDLPVEAVKEGIAATRWPGRFQVVGHEPDMVVDGAHNEAGVQSLLNELKVRMPNRPVTLICGVLADKDVAGMVKLLAGAVDYCVGVTVKNDRSLDGAVLVDQFRAYGVDSDFMLLKDAIENARERALRHNGVVVVAGSLFLVGELLELITTDE